VTILEEARTVIVSSDHVHKPNSTRELRNQGQINPGKLVSAFVLVDDAQSSTWKPAFTSITGAVNQHPFEAIPDGDDLKKDSLADSLYSTESLRKRVQGDME
jgi:hypothetical protein